MSEYGFIKVNGAMIDELDVKKAFELAENRLSVLKFDVAQYVVEFTLKSVLKGKEFSHLSGYEKKAIVEYIVENY